MKKADVMEFRKKMEQVFEKAAPNMNQDEMILAKDLCKPWVPGSHLIGEHYTANGQLWTCFQPYNNAVYPDVQPGSEAWGTFNKPYHGTTKETALPWVTPTGAHDIYQTGAYMRFLDGKIYKCLMATNFSPEEYAVAWEVQEE